MLLGVQTVGPKMAIAVLSGSPPRELLAAVAAGDVSRLRAPGVGKRTAERIIVELREKVSASIADEISVARVPDDDPRAQAREALAGLGYGDDEIRSLLDGADGGSVQELVSHALRSARR
jgi:Holliday junction DNA helicase RuvA